MKIEAVYYKIDGLSNKIELIYLVESISKDNFLVLQMNINDGTIKEGNISKGFLDREPRTFKVNKYGENTMKTIVSGVFKNHGN